MPFDYTKFYLGVNIGWLNHAYRHDLSDTFEDKQNNKSNMGRDPSSDADFEDIVDAYFRHLNFRQIKVVRMFLLEILEGMAFSNPILLPPRYSINDTFSYTNWSAFKNRISIIMNKAQTYGLQIYWCLLDAAGLLDKNIKPSYLWYRPLFIHLATHARDNFKHNILLPFLKSIDTFKANVFAIDIINEADWIWEKGIMSRSTVVSFIRDIYNFIVGYLPYPDTYMCTTSFHSHKNLTQTGVPQNEKVDFLDFYDYHRYLDPAAPDNTSHGPLPFWPEIKPCIIGEAGHHYPQNTNPTKAVDEQNQAKSSKVLMEGALKGNYTGVLLWRYAPVGDPHRLLRLTKSDTGSLCFPLSNFLTKFKAAAGTVTSGGQNPFKDFERPIWNEVGAFVGTIPPNKVP